MENMRSSYIKSLNNLDNWYVVKVSANQKYFEAYLKSNNKNMVCRIISPSYWVFNKWQVFIRNTDEFDGQWNKSSINLWFDDFSEMKHQINQINTDYKIGNY